MITTTTKQSASFRRNDVQVPTRDLARYAEGWLRDCEIRQLSARMIGTRRLIVDKLTWFLQQQECAECGVLELWQFLAYFRH